MCESAGLPSAGFCLGFGSEVGKSLGFSVVEAGACLPGGTPKTGMTARESYGHIQVNLWDIG